MRCASSRMVIAPPPDPNGAPAENIRSSARASTEALGHEFPTCEAINGARQAAGTEGRIPVTQERIRELTKTMLRKKLYVVLSKGGAAPEKLAEHLPRHLEYMIGLEKKGVLFASGPLAEADGKT